jgi:hypothetical protein
MQSVVAVLLVLNMKFEWWNATVLFVLWLAQFLMPHWRTPIMYVYGAWAVGLVLAWPWLKPAAPRILMELWRRPRGTR